MPIDEKRIILTKKGRNFLRKLRLEKGLPKSFNKQYATVIKWENGRNKPTINLFIKYLKNFDISLNFLKINNFLSKIAPSMRELAINKTRKIKQEKHKLLIKDYQKGFSLEKIGRKYGCSLTNVWYILKKYSIDTAKHGSGEKYSFPQSDYIKYLIKSKIKKNEILPLISSLLFTDGGIYFYKRNIVTTYYGSDKGLHDIFADLIWYYFNMRPNSYITKQGTVFRTKYINKRIANELLKLSPSYKTKPYFKEGWKIFLKNKKQPTLSFMKYYRNFVIKEVIRLAMCADGCIAVSNRKDRKTIMFTLMFACAHPKLVKGWANLFNRVNIKNNIVRGQSKTKIAGVKGIEDCIFKFYKLGGFINGVKVCVRASPLYGIEKQKILSVGVDLLKKCGNKCTVPIEFDKFKNLLI